MAINRRRNRDAEQTSGGDVQVGPYTVGVVGAGGLLIAGDRGVAVAGLTALENDGTMSTARSGDYGASITAFDGSANAATGNYGVAVAGKDSHSSATGGSGAIATITQGGTAEASDGGIASVRGADGTALVGMFGVAVCSHKGTAKATREGTALVESGTASAAILGLASVRSQGRASVGPCGVAIAWNEQSPGASLMPIELPADAKLGVVSAGQGGIIIAFMPDPLTGARRAMIGFVGVEDDALPSTQYGLKPEAYYRLDPTTGNFAEVVVGGRKRSKSVMSPVAQHRLKPKKRVARPQRDRRRG